MEEPRNKRGPSGLSEVREGRLTMRAIRQGWIDASNWPTDLLIDDLVRRQAAGQTMTAHEEALLAAVRLLDDNEHVGARRAGMRGIVAMERQNQIAALAVRQHGQANV